MKIFLVGLGLAISLPLHSVAADPSCSPGTGLEALKRFRHDVVEKVAATPNAVDPELALYAAYISQDPQLRERAFKYVSSKSSTGAETLHHALYLAGQFNGVTAPDDDSAIAALRILAANKLSGNARAAELWIDILRPHDPDAPALRRHLTETVLQPDSIDLSTEAFVASELRSRNLLAAPPDAHSLTELSTYSAVYSNWYSKSIREIATLFDCDSPLAAGPLMALQPFNQERLPPFEFQWAQWANATVRVAIARKMTQCKADFKVTQDLAEEQLTQKRLELKTYGPFVYNSQDCQQEPSFGAVLLVYMYNFWYRMARPGDFQTPKVLPTAIG